MSSIKTTQIDGDVSVGRNTAIGGGVTVQGSSTIKGNLRVDGWLDAKNIKGANKGLFTTLAKLKEAFPHPRNGWWVIVGRSLPGPIYVGDGGEWVATGQNGGSPVIEGETASEGTLFVDEVAKSTYLSLDRSDSHILYAPSCIDNPRLPIGEVVYPFRLTDGITLNKQEIRKYGPATEDMGGVIRFRLTELGNYIIRSKTPGGNRTVEIVVTEAEAAAGHIVNVDDYIEAPTEENSTGARAGTALRRYVRIYKIDRNNLEHGFAYRYTRALGYSRITHRRPILTKDTLRDPETKSRLLVQPKLAGTEKIGVHTKIDPMVFVKGEWGLPQGNKWRVKVKKIKTALVRRKNNNEKRIDTHYTGYSDTRGRTLSELEKVKSILKYPIPNHADKKAYFDFKITYGDQEIARYRATKISNEEYIVRRI